MHLRAAMGLSLGGLCALNNFITVLRQHCMRLRAAVLLQMALYVFADCKVFVSARKTFFKQHCMRLRAAVLLRDGTVCLCGLQCHFMLVLFNRILESC